MRFTAEGFAAWAASRPDVRAHALVGSRARGDAHPGSDIDLVLLTNSPGVYTESWDWAEAFGEVKPLRTRVWGEVVERRLRLPNGTDLDLAVGTPAWRSSAPPELTAGMVVLYDPDALLSD